MRSSGEPESRKKEQQVQRQLAETRVEVVENDDLEDCVDEHPTTPMFFSAFMHCALARIPV